MLLVFIITAVLLKPLRDTKTEYHRLAWKLIRILTKKLFYFSALWIPYQCPIYRHWTNYWDCVCNWGAQPWNQWGWICLVSVRPSLPCLCIVCVDLCCLSYQGKIELSFCLFILSSNSILFVINDLDSQVHEWLSFTLTL